jgi:outer membrane protein OmpA-like peptidoglycan-associated protein
MLINRYISLILLLCCCFAASIAQTADGSSSSRRATRLYERAVEHYTLREFGKALPFAEQALAVDANYLSALLIAGDISMELKNNDKAISFLSRAVSLNADYYPPALYILANLYLRNGFYQQALDYFQKYAVYKLPPDERSVLNDRIFLTEHAIQLLRNPVPFNPVNLGNKVNTVNDEYVNSISADGKTMIYTVRSPETEATVGRKSFREAFYTARFLDDGNWTAAGQLRILGEESDSEGALSIAYDNSFIVFTACHRPDGFGSCDLYMAVRKGNEWVDPVNLGPVVNSSRWESQPSISGNGRDLYFASNRPGGFGGSDIWKSTRLDNGRWSTPENLGKHINTEFDEMAPFIHPDGQTLYFSSRGHPGMGGADLFMSRKNEDGIWSEPANLGYPINTHADEINLVVTPAGNEAFISSDLQEGWGGYDVYSFQLHDQIKPLPVSYIKGVVRHAKTMKPLAARIELIDLKTGQTLIETRSTAETGEFINVLPSGNNYALHISRSGFLFYSGHFSLEEQSGFVDPFTLEIYLYPLEEGQKVVLRNIFFSHDSDKLQDASLTELNRLIEFLNEHPHLGLEISGHTDNTGSQEYNLDLSARRAKSVVAFLETNNINRERLSFAGKGDTKPVDTNETPEGRANNRRTEFKITYLKPD